MTVAVIVLMGIIYWKVSRLMGELEAIRVAKVEKEKLLADLKYSPESFRAESPYYVSEVPACQFSVHQFVEREGGKDKILLGHGVRVGDHIIVPTHVINTPGEVILWARRTTKDGQELSETIRKADLNWEELCYDVSYAVCPTNLGRVLKSAVVGGLQGKVYVEIATAFATDNSSGSYMEKAGFGMLEYHGSTRPGFSGAAYKYGARIVAMHLGGGVQNLAVSLSYVANLLLRPESSDTAALERILRTQNREDWEYVVAGNLEEYQVYAGGRYYLIDRDEFHEILLRNKFEEVGDEYEDHRKVKVRRGTKVVRPMEELYEPEVNDEAVTTPAVPFLVQASTAGPSNTSSTELRTDCPDPDILRPTDSISQVTLSSDGQRSELMQLNTRLSSIVESMRRRDEMLMDLMQQNAAILRLCSDNATSSATPPPQVAAPIPTPRISTSVSIPSISRERPVLESLGSTRPSVTPLDGMELSARISRMLRDSGVILPEGLRVSVRPRRTYRRRRSNISSSGNHISEPRENRAGTV